jgi:hypothetical protein
LLISEEESKIQYEEFIKKLINNWYIKNNYIFILYIYIKV